MLMKWEEWKLIVTQVQQIPVKVGLHKQNASFYYILDGIGKIVSLSWQSKKLTHVTKGPLASETLALGDGPGASYLLGILNKMLLLPNISDNKCHQQINNKSKCI